MPHSNFDFSVKFFRPPQRTVSCHNGLLDTRTKHTIAQDRLVVAEQRILDIERRKSATHLQLLSFEQKQLEKRLSSRYNLDQSLQTRHRSISEVNLHQINETSEIIRSKLYTSLNYNNQNLLSPAKTGDFHRPFSSYSDGDIVSSDPESDDEDNSKSLKKKPIQLPIVFVIPPEEDNLFLVQ